MNLAIQSHNSLLSQTLKSSGRNHSNSFKFLIFLVDIHHSVAGKDIHSRNVMNQTSISNEVAA